MNTKHLLLSSIAIPAAFSHMAAAQDTPQESIVIEEVTVTAQKTRTVHSGNWCFCNSLQR